MSVWRQILVYALILNIVGSTLMVPLIYLDFNLRREYIAKVLCINKEEPITICGGHCYLIKQLGKAGEQQEKEATTNHKSEILFFSLLLARLDFSSLANELDQNPAKWEALMASSAFLADIFRPPQVS